MVMAPRDPSDHSAAAKFRSRKSPIPGVRARGEFDRKDREILYAVGVYGKLGSIAVRLPTRRHEERVVTEVVG